MKNSIVAGLVIIVAAAAGYIVQLQYSLSLENPETTQAVTGDRVEFVLTHVDGSERRLSDWDGESRLVNFWATWCGPCRREIPLLIQLQTDKPEKRLQVIGVAVDFMEEVRAYAEDARFNYPILVGQADVVIAARRYGNSTGMLPFSVLVDAGGIIRWTRLGALDREELETQIHALR